MTLTTDISLFALKANGAYNSISANSTAITGLTVSGDANFFSVNGGPLAGLRNRIINGNFDFWQRGTSFTNPAANVYTADRWALSYDGAGATRTISRQTFTLGQTEVPFNPTSYFRYLQGTAGSGGTFNVIYQPIENVRTFQGRTVTVSFFARGAASMTLPQIMLRQNFGTGGSPSASVDTSLVSNVNVTTSFAEYTYTVTLPSIAGKTLGNNGDDSLQLFIFLPVNATFTFDLAQIQLEEGTIATPFENRPYGTELALCQRYYEPCVNFWTGQTVATAFYYSASYYSVPKRATPTATNIFQTGAGNGGFNNRSIASISSTFFTSGGSSTGTINGAGWFDSWAISAEL